MEGSARFRTAPWNRVPWLAAGEAGVEEDPDPDRLRGTLLAYTPPSPSQRTVRARMLAFLDEHPDALERTCIPGHFTASALVVDASDRSALLTRHRKLGRWLQLGGHCDGNANAASVALREAIEESGIDGLRIAPFPVDLDVHTIPTRPGEPAHLHLDLRFLVRAPAGAVPRRSSESLQLSWVQPDELAALEPDPSLLRLFGIAFTP